MPWVSLKRKKTKTKADFYWGKLTHPHYPGGPANGRWSRISQSSPRLSQALKTSKLKWRPGRAVSIVSRFDVQGLCRAEARHPIFVMHKGSVRGGSCQRPAFRGALRQGRCLGSERCRDERRLETPPGQGAFVCSALSRLKTLSVKAVPTGLPLACFSNQPV